MRDDSLTKKILDAVKKAKEIFDIENFPGDFFTHIENGGYAEKNKILLFREDIDRLSGFIGYGKAGYTAICINYKRSVGHQNFTLAHEIGHWMMHRGKNISDTQDVFWSNEDIELEASRFARELLYPEQMLIADCHEAILNGYFDENKRVELGKYVDELCHKYWVSFELVLKSLLYKVKKANRYSVIRKEIEKASGKTISELYERSFYVPDPQMVCYKQYSKPYREMEKKVLELVKQKKIGEATGEAILLRNKSGD